jgi:hypothetical protein
MIARITAMTMAAMISRPVTNSRGHSWSLTGWWLMSWPKSPCRTPPSQEK